MHDFALGSGFLIMSPHNAINLTLLLQQGLNLMDPRGVRWILISITIFGFPDGLPAPLPLCSAVDGLSSKEDAIDGED